jgi:hypothetical protein
MHGITDSVPESIERLHDRSRNRFSGMSVKQLSPPSFGDVDDLHRRPSTQLWKQQHHRGSGLQTVNVWGFASLNECIVFNYVGSSGEVSRAYLAKRIAPITLKQMLCAKRGMYDPERAKDRAPMIGTSRPQQFAMVLPTAFIVAVALPPTSIMLGENPAPMRHEHRFWRLMHTAASTGLRATNHKIVVWSRNRPAAAAASDFCDGIC